VGRDLNPEGLHTKKRTSSLAKVGEEKPIRRLNCPRDCHKDDIDSSVSVILFFFSHNPSSAPQIFLTAAH
jgi:hypothetical protein